MAAEPAIILFESEMRRTRRSRASGREQVVDDLFSTRGLEADPIPEGADQQFSLRPFAAAVPQDDLVNTEPESNEPTTDRLYRRAADAATKGRVAEAIQRYREILSLEPEHLAARNNLSLLLESAGTLHGSSHAGPRPLAEGAPRRRGTLSPAGDLPRAR